MVGVVGSMLQLETVEYPHKFLTCYESVLMTLLKYQGITEEALLMGTQAYFVFSPAEMSLSARFNSVDEEWHRLFGCRVETAPAESEQVLHQKLVARLEAGVPVCLPVDLFLLPHTLHHQQLHQHHYVTVFGVENGRYYMVCPYYRFQGWVEAELLHSGFFSPVVAAKGAFLITLPQFELPPISEPTIHTWIEENCHYMLNLAVPEALAGVAPRYLGVQGIQTFDGHFQQMVDEPDHVITYQSQYINLSRHFTTVGHSRYWFHQLIQNYCPTLFSENSANELQNLFAEAIQAWKALGIRLGMGVHSQRAKTVRQVALDLKKMVELETRLFNTLLGTLPHYEQGTL